MGQVEVLPILLPILSSIGRKEREIEGIAS